MKQLHEVKSKTSQDCYLFAIYVIKFFLLKYIFAKTMKYVESTSKEGTFEPNFLINFTYPLYTNTKYKVHYCPDGSKF